MIVGSTRMSTFAAVTSLRAIRRDLDSDSSYFHTGPSHIGMASIPIRHNVASGGYALKRLLLSAHPFLFALDSLLYLYMKAISEADPAEIVRPLIVLWMVLLALYPFARKIAGNGGWGQILLTLFVFGLYFDRDYFTVVSILSTAVVVILLVSFRLLKRRFQDIHLSLSLSVISALLLIVESSVLLSWLNSIPSSYYDLVESRAQGLSLPLFEPASGVKPDIYFIVLDSYSGQAVLKNSYGYDNSDFINYLKDLGFVVPDVVLSNYPKTALSISSILDMQYWDSILPDGSDVRFWWPAKPVLNYSHVRTSLESIGYKTVSIASNWEITNNETTDYYFKPFPVLLTEYEDLIISSTALQLLHIPFQEIAPVRTNESHRRFFAYGMDTLEKIPEIKGPKFVFAHIFLPHAPFVFNADGSPIQSNAQFTFGSQLGLSQEEFRQGYIAHIEYVNMELRSLIKTILEKSATPPVILLQADHGLGLSISTVPSGNPCLTERFSAFGAYYLPGKGPDVIPKEFTPINLFRIVLNEYFSADLALVENRHYWVKDNNMLAGMQNVTEQVGDMCVNIPHEE